VRERATDLTVPDAAIYGGPGYHGVLWRDNEVHDGRLCIYMLNALAISDGIESTSELNWPGFMFLAGELEYRVR
jgi:hypothetical protein